MCAFMLRGPLHKLLPIRRAVRPLFAPQHLLASRRLVSFSAGASDPPPPPPSPNADDAADATAAAHAPSLRSALPPSEVELPESSFLKCIEKEISDEKLRLDKEEGPPGVPAGWEVYHASGTSFFYGRRLWLPSRPPGDTSSASLAERHWIRVQLSSRDASLDPECDIRGEHFRFSFFVQRLPEAEAAALPELAEMEVMQPSLRAYDNSIEVRCDFIDGELVVDNVVFHGAYALPDGTNSSHKANSSGGHNNSEGSGSADSTVDYRNPWGGYPGPNLDECEEEVLDGIQAWLAERRVDDQLGEFIGQYSVWVEQAEYERWLQQLYNYVAA